MSINNTDIIFKVLTNNRTKSKSSGGNTRFTLSGLTIAMPNKLADKIISLLKKKRMSTLQEILELYTDSIKTNF